MGSRQERGRLHAGRRRGLARSNESGAEGSFSSASLAARASLSLLLPPETRRRTDALKNPKTARHGPFVEPRMSILNSGAPKQNGAVKDGAPQPRETSSS